MLCLGFALLGSHPPAKAQGDSSGVQNEKIREIGERQRNSDDHQQKQWDKVNALESEMTQWQGRVEGFALFFTLLSGGSIVLQVRKPK